MRIRAALAPLFLAVAAVSSPAAADPKACVVLLLHERNAAPAAMAAFGRKLAPVCQARAMEMPWSARRNNDKDVAGAWQEVARAVREARQQGVARVLVGGWGYGANAAMAYLAAIGETDGVISIAPEAEAVGIGALPATAAGMRQHAPALWVVGTDDPLHQRGEDYAFSKAPPHPMSRYVTVKADRKGTPDAAAKVVLDWIKSLQ